ncbi:long-chain fatty acid--CoA ligase [candidate division KSB1 bacterium]|nr:long-chain fatty acid--CoA ligase [candidate division KSB1 bacterium]
MPIKDFRNVHAMLKETVDRYPNQPAYRWFPEAGKMAMVTWTQFYEEVQMVAKSLIALGVKKNDKVNILSYTCYRWMLCDLGITSAGACTVGIYHSNLPKDCRHIINHSDGVLVFAEDETQLRKLLEIRKDLPNVRKVVLFNGSSAGDDWVMSFEEFVAAGKDVAEAEFFERALVPTPQDAAGIVYTSGTTGVPKGAVLTHDNITFTAQSARTSVDIWEGDEHFLFLPLAHVFARICVYTSLLAGNPTTFSRSMDTIIDDIKTIKPHWFASVPRVFEKVYTKVVSGAEAKGGLALKIFRWACRVGNEVSDCKLKQQPIPAWTNVQYRLATKLVFSKLQAALGGRVRWCISGAAPINPAIAKFFHAAGILVLEGIGMTENTSFTNVNRYDNYRFGWVGQPGPGIEQKTGPDGEIMYRGRNVMKEYYKMPAETAETITKDGWLKTGDLGVIDAANFLKVTGRKKELIITSGGKNIAPAPIEGALATCKYLSQVCVLGDRRRFLSALVSLNVENVTAYAKAKGLRFDNFDELRQHPEIVRLIEAEVAEKNRTFASFESVKKIAIVPEFTIENDMLTPTLKIKKNVVAEKYAQTIEAFYADNNGKNASWSEAPTTATVRVQTRESVPA